MAEEKDLEMEQVTAVTADYGEEQIQVLEGLEAVRKRPAERGRFRDRYGRRPRFPGGPASEDAAARG